MGFSRYGIGASRTFVTLPTTLYDDGAVFQVLVSDARGTIASSPATLRLRPSFDVAPSLASSGVSDADHTFIPADDPGYAFIGRIDDKDPAAPVLIWSGTTVKARFHGKSLGVNVDELRKQLRAGGPNAAESPVAHWYKINDLGQWADTPAEMTLATMAPEVYFAQRQRQELIGIC